MPLMEPDAWDYDPQAPNRPCTCPVLLDDFRHRYWVLMRAHSDVDAGRRSLDTIDAHTYAEACVVAQAHEEVRRGTDNDNRHR